MMEAVNNAAEIIRNEIASKRSSLQNLDKRLFKMNTEMLPQPCSIIEISGADSSGKTTLLQYIMSRVLMPEIFGGKHNRVVLLDLTHKFKPEKLLRQIEALIKSSQPSENTENIPSTQECNDIALDCLNGVVLINCYTAEEFLYAIEDVEQILTDDENSEIGLIAIDGLDAFYWLDAHDKKKRMRTHYTYLIEKLRSICNGNNVCCCHTVSSNYLEAKGPNLKEAAYVEHTLVLSNHADIVRTLNGLPFQISDDGILFP